jgi:YkoY family integral membrane protein
MQEFIQNLFSNFSYDLIQDIVDNPMTSLAIIGNLIIIESLLSVDNAAVLATMVMDLPAHQRDRALKYGIWGAYVFRGLAMIFAAVLLGIWWLKPLGGLYLLYLAYDFFNKKQSNADNEEEVIDKNKSWIYKITVGTFGHFWATVALVELMDMAFSIDNVFAAVAFTPNIILVCVGVFIGILAMRFIAQWFVKLMEKYPFLETAAFMVIAVLGLKLALSIITHLYPDHSFSHFLESEYADWGISIITVLIFLVPVVTSMLFNYPRKKEEE